MAVLAHPDDEALGFGGTIARYVSEGVDVSVVTATLGQRGRYHGTPPGGEGHPGLESITAIRREEIRGAAEVLGIRELTLLEYMDGELDRVDPHEIIGRISEQIRKARPQVVITFGPEGAYGHPDHIAISQFATAAVVVAADRNYGDSQPHCVSKLYYRVAPEPEWKAYQHAFKRMTSTVDGVERTAQPWPDWQITTAIDTRAQWPTVWRAVTCHDSQIAAYEVLKHLAPPEHEALWGTQHFYRAFSTVNGGRAKESDLFEGIRD